MSDNPATPLRVVVADDQRAIREALAMVIDNQGDMRVVGLASDGEQAVELAALHDAQVVLMDLRMPGTDGVAATRRLTAEQPHINVVILTTFADDTSITDALAAGAMGYITKDAGHREIVLAVRSAAAGQTVLDSAVHASLLRNALQGAPDALTPAEPPGELPDNLTPRETDILRAIAAGLTNTDIARDLYISETTVKSHINHLFRKINARNRAQAVRYAYGHGIGPQ
jgi:DNA-binding NarL/FixJ family response regulator